jgi:hypothetical protein
MPAIEKILLIDDDPDKNRLLKDAVHFIRGEIECDFDIGPTQAF